MPHHAAPRPLLELLARVAMGSVPRQVQTQESEGYDFIEPGSVLLRQQNIGLATEFECVMSV
ncbi:MULTISPECIES: hypothetical protein [Streptomyces]|uniref:hypothetical protein n=1 Tax=Streptomyces TaxID=1883 RepID=UPI001415C2D7|nr:hypothetical protein [Streptomyces sp. SID7805]MYU51015.1 hypothetical protein [Streptomyces sp. SID7805]